MDGKKKYWLSMALAGLVLLAVFLPGRLKQIQCDRFAKPLYSHALPEGSRLVQKSCVKGEAGDFTAALILASDLTEEELAAFFGDTEYPPAKKGQTVELAVKPLDSDSLSALAQAGLQRENEQYVFVYIYSA